MTKPEKDEVLETPEQANPGGSSSSPSSFGAAASDDTRSADGSKDSSAGGASKSGSAQTITPEVIDTEESSTDNKASGADTDEVLRQAVISAEMEKQEWKDKFVRLHAEWDTYRRRTAEQRTEEKATATEKLVEDLLPVIDDFERTIDYAEKHGEAGLLDGVKAVMSKLVDTLRKEGVEVLDPKGEAFDALKCQAISTLEDKAVPDETVAEVYQKGYKMGRKVLRPAMVTVATGGPKREVPKDTEQ